MSPGQGSESLVIFAVVAFGIAIVGVAALIVGNARTANTHLTNATKLSPSLLASPPNSLTNSPNERNLEGGTPQASAARTAQTTRIDAADSRQIFAQLNEYYAANVIQGNSIFWASLLSMIVGFAFITFGIVKAGASSTTAIIAGVAGIFSQFIAATFLVALRSTQEQSTAYAQTLMQLRLRDVGAAADAESVTLGLAILNEIPDDGTDTLANQTRAAIAMGLIVRNGPSLLPATPTPPAPAPAPLGPAPIAPIAAVVAPPTKTRTQEGIITFDSADATDSPRPPQR